MPYTPSRIVGPAISIYQYIAFHSRMAVLITCLLVLLISTVLFVAMGTWEADLSALGIHSRTQLLGMLTLMTLMPTWLLGCFFVTQRHTMMLARQLEEQYGANLGISAQVTRLPARQIILGITGGFIYALAFNVPLRQLGEAFSGNMPFLSIFLGQFLVWCCIGFLLAIRLHTANLFYQLGKTIELSIFEQSRLEPFARVGLLDVVIVVGSMVITSVQSMDAHFRLENYLTIFLVAVPAGAALLIRPMWTLHRRLVVRKRQLLLEINKQIVGAPEDTKKENIDRLEILLQRRDRVRALATWPLDMATWVRLLLYVLLPPLAWVAAALVEVAITGALGV